MIEYKIDVMEALKMRGYSTARIRREKILAEATMERLKKKESITTKTMGLLCVLLRCQPSDIFQVTTTDEEKLKYF